MNPRLPWRTQHDFADAVGPPWVISAPLADFPRHVASAVAFQARQAPGSRLPADYGDAAILRRAEVWLREAVARGR